MGQTTTEKGLGWEWQQIRLRILSRDCGLCQSCLRSGLVKSGREVDHIKPRSKGGTNDDDNLQTICDECHADKTARDEGRRRKHRVGLDGWPE